MAHGDHIKVKRLGGLYTHHGIDLGDGTVVHFDGEPLNMMNACVRRTSMEEFLIGGTVIVVEHAGSAREADQVVEEALARLGETGYDLFRNNCEHFAHACKLGKPRSRQARRAVRIGVGTVATVATFAMLLSAGAAAKALNRLANRRTA